MTAEEIIAALNLPLASRVDQRVPKKLLLENGASTAADKRLINEGIEELRWLAALKPAVSGVPEFHDGERHYAEIAVLQVALRPGAKLERLVELIHRAVPYPIWLLIDHGNDAGVSLAHKRNALNEAEKVVLDGELVTVDLNSVRSEILASFLSALDISRQPRSSMYSLYQGWMDTVFALQAASITGVFRVLDTTELAVARREALRASLELQSQISSLRGAAAKASQMARQVELNLELKKLERELAHVREGL